VSLLLDTHVFRWWLADDRRLGRLARRAIEGPEARVLVSAASIWEIAIKLSIGKLTWRKTRVTTLATCIEDSGLAELAVNARHAAAVRALPFHHADPFDRLLCAQAMEEGLRIVTADETLARYDVDILRAEQ
jgi:PIN domain nuclease of toxin-antitoxin system